MARLVEHGKTLYSVTVQDENSLKVLMSAFADDQALQLTNSTGLAHFYSRSRQTLWRKGDTSGNRILVSSVIADCDQDSYLYLATPTGPVCHLGTDSCFRDSPNVPNPLRQLQQYIQQAETKPRDGSYTTALLTGDLERLVKKVGEEAIEVITAAYASPPRQQSDLIWESVDLLYHLSVLWTRYGITLDALQTEIVRRHQPSPPSALRP